MSTSTEQREALAAAHPDVWIPVNTGDTLEGEIIDVDVAWSDQRNGDYPLLTIQTEDDREIKLHCFKTVLYREVLKWRPEVGEMIRVVYQGTGQAKGSQSPPELYRVRVTGGERQSVQRLYDRIESSESK